MSIIVTQLSYQLPQGQWLLKDLHFTLASQKIGLVGANGIGKSTFLKLLNQELKPTEGKVATTQTIAKLPQDFLSFQDQSVAQVLGIAEQLQAFHQILKGEGTLKDYEILNDAWDIEEKVQNLLSQTQLSHIDVHRAFSSLSGGEKSRLLFAVLLWQQVDFLLLDEPTNHLDQESRERFYKLIEQSNKGMLVVSHDRALLRKMDEIIELSPLGIQSYGGNYDFYKEQKSIEQVAKEQSLHAAQIELKRKQRQQQKTKEKQEKRATRGKKHGIKSNMEKDVMNYFQNRSEKSATKSSKLHEKQLGHATQKLQEAQSQVLSNHQIIIDLAPSSLPKSKRIIQLKDVNVAFQPDQKLWENPLDFEIVGPERVALVGTNGSGKTTLLKILLETIKPTEGKVYRGVKNIGFIDQHLELIDYDLTVLENVQKYALSGMEEHTIRIRLGRFLFDGEKIFKKASVLSGGERMRLGLACLLATNNAPDLLILDEPTNHMDFQSLAIITSALQQFKGAILVVSHDQDFLKTIGIERYFNLTKLK